jgi:hypothetical protein
MVVRKLLFFPAKCFPAKELLPEAADPLTAERQMLQFVLFQPLFNSPVRWHQQSSHHHDHAAPLDCRPRIKKKATGDDAPVAIADFVVLATACTRP